MVHICKFEEVMFVSKIYAVFSFCYHLLLAPAGTFEGEFSNRKRLYFWSRAKIFQFSGWEKILIFALTCCSTILTSGCGAGISQSVGSGLLVSPGSVNFGTVPVGNEVDSSVSLSNNGSSPVVISQVDISGQPFSVLGSGDMPVTLPAGGTYVLKVGFIPVFATSYSAQLTLIDALARPIAHVSMQGQGSSEGAPQLTISAASLRFDSVMVNTATTQSLTLTSTGTSPVTVSSAAITGAGFAIVGGSLPATLNPSHSMTLQVQFNPTSPGAASGQIAMSSNSSSGSTTVVALSGTSTTALSPQLAVSVASLSFGSVTVNTSTTRSMTLTSTGMSPVTVNSVAIIGAGFTIVGGTLPATLNPTQSMTMQVQCLPTVTGATSGQITISSNSSTGSLAVVALSGTGTAANPQLTMSSTSLSFGSIAVNTATRLTLTLTSSGTTPVTVNSVKIAGAGFAIIGGRFPVTLNPTQAVMLQLQFEPTTTGAVTGQLTISSNSTSASTAVVALSGTGTSTAHEVDLSWNAPTSSPDPVAGYNIYRSTGSGSLVLMNSSPDSSVVYVDSTVVSGATYSYVVKSVDSSSVESVASNQITVTIP